MPYLNLLLWLMPLVKPQYFYGNWGSKLACPDILIPHEVGNYILQKAWIEATQGGGAGNFSYLNCRV